MNYLRPKLGLPTNIEPSNQLVYHDSPSQSIVTHEVQEEFCGLYKKGHEVSATLVQVEGVNKFVFITQQIEAKFQELIQVALRTKYISGHLFYASRVYTTDIGDIKLYRRKDGKPVERCRILDMFTSYDRGKLFVHTTILFIDKGIMEFDVPLDNLFEFPQTLSYYKDLEPRAKRARLSFGPAFDDLLYNSQVSEYFIKRIAKNPSSQMTIVIKGYENDWYYVDILDKSKRSMVTHLKEKFRDQVYSKVNKLVLQYAGLDKTYQDMQKNQNNHNHNHLTRKNLMNGNSPVKNDKKTSSDQVVSPNHDISQKVEQPKRYYGVVTYYKNKFYQICQMERSRQSKLSYIAARLCDVKIITWSDPENIFIVPYEKDYYSNHDEFWNQLDQHQESFDKKNNMSYSNQKFDVGQMCLCRNKKDHKLGKWMRAVVLEARGTKTNGFLNQDGLLSGSVNGKLDNFSPDTMYRLRLIDFGLECIRSAINMRHITDEKLFSQKGAWAMRCRLFGIRPIDYGRSFDKPIAFSQPCIQAMNCWIHQRLVNSSDTKFTVLFRSSLGKDKMLPYPTISLFHRFEPFSSSNDYLTPQNRRVKYSCLNTALIDQGMVLNEDLHCNYSSQVELDEYLLDKLVPHGLIADPSGD